MADDDQLAGRSVAVDLVRVIGVIAIVAGHTWDQRHFAQVGLYTWHVPVFFLLTGYLWKPGRSSGSELKRRARTLLVPYVSWLVIVSIVWFGFRALRGEPLDVPALEALGLGGYWLHRPYSAYWFVTSLFFATVLFRWLTNQHRFLPWFAAGLGVAWCIGDPHGVALFPEGALLALPAMAFMLVGVVLRRYRHTIERPVVFGLILLVPAWWLGWSGAIAPLNMYGGNLGTPVLGVLMASAISCGLILCAEGVESNLRGWLRPVILEVAACAIPIILTHALVLAILERYRIPDTKWSFLLAYFVPLAVALALRRTPARRLLF